MKKMALLAIFATLACRTADMPIETPNSDLLLIQAGTVFTGERLLHDHVVVIRGDRIEAIVPEREAFRYGTPARTIEARNMTVLPGLVDSHAHIAGLGDALDAVSLIGTPSYEAMIERIAAKAATTPAGEWLLGRGWDQNDWPVKEFPVAAPLDAAVPSLPVWMRRIDGHAGLANSEAMRLAGITKTTADPEGGKIVRDAEGSPTGVFIDNAMNLVEAVIPAPSRATRKRRLIEATRTIAASGLTAVHEAGVSDATIELYKELIAEGALPIRVYAMLDDNEALLAKWFAQGALVDHGNRLTVRSVKLYADGALGSRGAALHHAYADDPHNTGLLVTSPDHIADVASRARAAGFQVGTHAIGDRGTSIVLDAYEKAGVRPADRFRVEHLQVSTLEDFPRLARLGVIASMQPTHATSDMYWAEERLGSERVHGAYAWRKVLDAGAPLAFGSDFPVEEVSPFLGIHASVNRRDREGWPPGGWYPEEALSLAETIGAFTAGAAWAAFEEKTRGAITPGMFADFTIVEGDLFEADPETLDDAVVAYTIVNGEVVYGE